MDNNENKNQENNINFQNMIDNNITPSINDVLPGNVSVNNNNNNNDIQSNVDNVVEKDLGEKQKNSSSCSYCECCGRLIDNEGNLLGIDGKNKDLLINTFIGKNSEKIRNQQFSVPLFIFTYFYLAYRKMYLYAFYLFIFNLIFFMFFVFLLNIFSSISPIIFYAFWFICILIINARLSLEFPKIYFKFIKSKIKNFEINDKVNFHGLLYLCNRKGGTNKIFIFFYILDTILKSLFLLLILILRAAYS